MSKVKINIWTKKNAEQTKTKNGLFLRIESDVDHEVRRAHIEFAKWLRREYLFPVPVKIYVKAATYVLTQDGDAAFGTCFRPFDKQVNPHIVLATGDYSSLVEKRGRDNALASLLHCMATMLTHYYQWLYDVNDLTVEQEEKQACYYASKILKKYSLTRDHP